MTIGPVIEDGFYYDFAFKRGFTEDDLATIEARMRDIAKRDYPVQRTVMPRDKAAEFFRAQGEEYKAQIIEDIPKNEDISLYRQGEFVDLCRGPHVPTTGKLKAFKLMKVAGAYWRGDSKNEMLARIYGTAWRNDDELKIYLHGIEEGRKARPPQSKPRPQFISHAGSTPAWCFGTSAAGAYTKPSSAPHERPVGGERLS